MLENINKTEIYAINIVFFSNFLTDFANKAVIFKQTFSLLLLMFYLLQFLLRLRLELFKKTIGFIKRLGKRFDEKCYGHKKHSYELYIFV